MRSENMQVRLQANQLRRRLERSGPGVAKVLARMTDQELVDQFAAHEALKLQTAQQKAEVAFESAVQVR